MQQETTSPKPPRIQADPERGLTPEQVQAATEAELIVSPALRPMV